MQQHIYPTEVISSLKAIKTKHDSGIAIELRDLHKAYRTPAGQFPALKGINLQVKQGEFLAVVGKSGAGKTTLVNLISTIDRPTSGEIFIHGSALHTMKDNQKDRWRGKNLGIVFQFFQLLPNLSLVENITITMDFLNSYPIFERRERALQLLELVGIAEHANKTPAKISGGQQQRVAIARAMANDPAILLADEPTGNLDSRTAAEIFDIFAALADQEKTVIVVTHDKEIASWSSRVVELHDGQIQR